MLDEQGEPRCKYGYPRDWLKGMVQVMSNKTGRYIYRCEKEEDRLLSPYIPLWLLATGAPLLSV